MTVELHMLPVPDGDATLIIDRSKGRSYSLLIDTGLAKEEVVSYLQSVGIYHLDLIILSHPDLDHLQGLLSIIDNPLISVDRIWCFDLSFLKEFVTTGKLPQPKDPTHKIIYFRFVSTLVEMDKVLNIARGKRIPAFQVSEGYRINLGSLHLEVLYPWDGFYNALRSPVKLKALLRKKWPEDWIPHDWPRDNIEGEQLPFARKIRVSQKQEVLENLLDNFESVDIEETNPLAVPEVEESEESEVDLLESGNDKIFPISLLGTLYNNLSIVVKIHVLGGINSPVMLFPGDLADWTYLIRRRLFDLTAHIFKYPHHGSAGPWISRQLFKRYPLPFTNCPYGPWCHPDCCDWQHRLWKKVYNCIFHSCSTPVFREVVRPSHTLVFPYPSQRLPQNNMFAQGMGKIHANRRDEAFGTLNDRKNPPVPHVLKIGKEKCKIEVLGHGRA